MTEKSMFTINNESVSWTEYHEIRKGQLVNLPGSTHIYGSDNWIVREILPDGLVKVGKTVGRRWVNTTVRVLNCTPAPPATPLPPGIPVGAFPGMNPEEGLVRSAMVTGGRLNVQDPTILSTDPENLKAQIVTGEDFLSREAAKSLAQDIARAKTPRSVTIRAYVEMSDAAQSSATEFNFTVDPTVY